MNTDAAVQALTLTGLVSATVGFLAKSLWDSVLKQRDARSLESWKIKARILEDRLSVFYWPLYVAFARDDLLWEKAFKALNGAPRPEDGWVEQLSPDQRRAFAGSLKSGILLPNHQAAAQIIREKMHLANAGDELSRLLGRYVRHVDVLQALQQSGISDLDPMTVGEPFPSDLSAAVKVKLDRYQLEYEELLRERGVLDLRSMSIFPEVHGPIAQN